MCKKRIVFFLLLLSVATYAQKIGNLVPNPSFEEGNNSPDPWIIHHSIKGDWAQYSSAEWATDEVHSGKKSIKVSVSKSAGKTLGWRISEENPIPVKGGKKVRVSGWMKTKDVVMGPTEYCVPCIIFTTYDINKKVVKRYWIGRAVSPKTEWTKYEKVIKLKDEVEYFTLSAGLTNCTGTAWFDDFEVSYVEDTSSIEYLSSLANAKDKKKEDIPIIIPRPYKEQYAPEKFFIISKAAIFMDNFQEYRQIKKETEKFFKKVFQCKLAPIYTEKEMAGYETVILVGRKGGEIIEKYLKQLAIDINWEELGPQGYLLAVRKARNKNFIILSGNTEQGIYYGVQTLKQYPVKKDNRYQMIEGIIFDKPDYLWRGLVPGSTSIRRIDTWMVPLKINVIYGVPSTGSYEWWIPFTEEYKSNLKRWVEECKKRFIIPVAGERPDRGYVRRIRFSSSEDINAILQRYRDYYECGIRHFKLAFDDGPPFLEYPQDKKVFKNLAEAHFYLTNQVYKLLKNLNPENQLSLCPLHYYNPLEWSPQQKEYIKTLSKLPKDILFINVSTTTKEKCEEFINLTGRKPLIWDNWVSEFEAMKLPPTLVPPPSFGKNDKELPDYSTGYMFPLLDKEIFWYLASDYMWNAARYNPEESYSRVVRKMFGSEVFKKLREYYQFLQINYKLPVKGYTPEEMRKSIQDLIEKFNYFKTLKGNVPEDLEQEIITTVKNRVELLKKVFLPQIDTKPLPVPIPFTENPPKIDGILEKIWKKATVLKNFQRPVSQRGKEAPQPTEVFLLHDRKNLYMFFKCYEPHPEKIKTKIKKSDSEVYLDDCVEVMFSPADKTDSYYHIAVNSIGTVYDALLFDKKWNSDVIVKTHISEDRWSAEMAIPLKNLGIEKVEGNKMYFNLFRERYAGKVPEFTSWAVVEKRFHEPERFWVLEFK